MKLHDVMWATFFYISAVGVGWWLGNLIGNLWRKHKGGKA